MKKLIISLLLVISGYTCFSQGWPKIIIENNTGPRKVIETYDKGYLIISNIYISNYHRYIWLIKTDIDGNILWDKKIGEGSYRYYIDDINQTYDGGYILVFRCSKYDIDLDPIVMKLNPCAEIEWCTTLHSEGFNRGVKVIQTPDSNYLTLSMYHSSDWAERIFLFKLDESGEVLWSQLYAQLEPGLYNEEGVDLTVFPNDSSYLITGTCEYIPTSSTNGFWIKILEDGTELYNIVWNDSIFELNTANQTVNQSDYFYSIGSKIYNSVFHPTIYKITNDGIKESSFTILNNTYGGTGSTLSILNDSLLVVGGRWEEASPPFQGHCEVFITDTIGNVHHQRTLFDDLQSPRNTEITFDNKILVMCGFYIGSSWDIYFYKLNQYLEDDTLYNIQLTYDSLCPGTIISDTMTIDCDMWVDIDEMFEPELNSILKIFPNPASDCIQIEIPSYLLSEATINGFNVTSAHKLEGDLILSIYDGFGKRVLEKEVPSNKKSIEVNISALHSGLHIAVLTVESKVISSGKFIINQK
jgi:hypothetical protein